MKNPTIFSCLGIDVAKLGVAPVNKYELYGGGRFFPSVTREASISCSGVTLAYILAYILPCITHMQQCMVVKVKRIPVGSLPFMPGFSPGVVWGHGKVQ